MSQFNPLGDEQVQYIKDIMAAVREKALKLIEDSALPSEQMQRLENECRLTINNYLDAAVLNMKQFEKDPKRPKAKEQFVPLPPPSRYGRAILDAIQKQIDEYKQLNAKGDDGQEDKG